MPKHNSRTQSYEDWYEKAMNHSSIRHKSIKFKKAKRETEKIREGIAKYKNKQNKEIAKLAKRKVGSRYSKYPRILIMDGISLRTTKALLDMKIHPSTIALANPNEDIIKKAKSIGLYNIYNDITENILSDNTGLNLYNNFDVIYLDYCGTFRGSDNNGSPFEAIVQCLMYYVHIGTCIKITFSSRDPRIKKSREDQLKDYINLIQHQLYLKKWVGNISISSVYNRSMYQMTIDIIDAF